MRNDMKRNNRVSDIFGVFAVFAIFAGCVEKLDGSPTMWTVGCLAVAFVFGLLSKATEEKSTNTIENHEQ